MTNRTVDALLDLINEKNRTIEALRREKAEREDTPVVFAATDPAEHGYEFNTPGGNA